jgi:NAD(P)H-hydrate epimerase
MFVVTASEMQKMDGLTIQEFGLPGRILMENAGRGAAEMLLKRISNQPSHHVGILAGRGNNGGDGFVIARYLAQKDVLTGVYLLTSKDRVSGDAADNLALLASIGIPVIELPDPATFADHESDMARHTLWVDALLGTGLNADVIGLYRQAIEFLNRSQKPVLSVDIPSGLSADTGLPMGCCVRADTTVTFGFPKIGHMLYPGAEYTGKLHTIDIGIPPHIVRQVNPRQELITDVTIQQIYHPRMNTAHKGNAGHLLIVAGSPGKAGAAALAGRGSLRCGAGLVTLAAPANVVPILQTLNMEAMAAPLPETEDGFLSEAAFEFLMKTAADKKCIALGPGIGTHPETVALVHRIMLNARIPLVIDADGLNGLSLDTTGLKQANAPIILTPHPGEMARLAGCSVADVQADRIGVARHFSVTHRIYLILKGARTLVALPNGKVYVNPTANPGMASGGMGDVLTGIIGALVAQGYGPEDSCRLGVYLHGQAADNLKQSQGPQGFLASDVADEIPRVFQKIHENRIP